MTVQRETTLKLEVAEEEQVHVAPLEQGQDLPLVVTSAREDVDLAQWARDHREGVDRALLHNGAILFRGFGIDSAIVFERFAGTVCTSLFNENGEHPRESVSGNVYTPVAYSPRQKLLWHNENSFNLQWPRKILFCCVRPADRGGETPIVDSREVFKRIRPELRDKFIARDVMYVRNYTPLLGLSWQSVFQTSERKKAEEICAESEMLITWKEGDSAMTRTVRPAVAKCPLTGQVSWFNQAQHFHPSCMDPKTRKDLELLFDEEDMPRNCLLGDGNRIEDSEMKEIMDVYRELEVTFPWQAGDVLLVDNLLVAHGRNPYGGERKLLVAMGDMMSYKEL